MRLPPENRSLPSPRLPTEICERVIDWVAEEPGFDGSHRLYADGDALKSLRACALTCRAWTARARIHMFRNLRILCALNIDGNTADLSSLLAANPALPLRVKVVIAKALPEHYSTLHIVPFALPQLLPRLEYLRLARGLFHPAPCIFPAMNRFTSVTKLSLDEVVFYSTHDLRRTIGSFRALQILELWDISWHIKSFSVDMSPRSSYCPQSAVRLKKLLIVVDRTWLLDRRSVPILEWLGKSGILSSLEVLSLCRMMILSSRMLAAVETAIQAAAISLEKVWLAIGPEIEFSKCM